MKEQKKSSWGAVLVSFLKEFLLNSFEAPKILIYLPVSELTCILSSAYKKEKVSEHPPSKLCTLRPWSLNHGYYIRLFTCPQGGFWCFC